MCVSKHLWVFDCKRATHLPLLKHQSRSLTCALPPQSLQNAGRKRQEVEAAAAAGAWVWVWVFGCGCLGEGLGVWVWVGG